MADYLASYASHFGFDVRTGVTVTGLSRVGDRYLVTADNASFEADHVVVAMATFQKPQIPVFGTDLDPSIVQLHSSEYRNLTQLNPGGVLVVGAGNSGAEIALETARAGHETWISGRDVGKVPVAMDSVLGRAFFARFLLRVVFHRVLTIDTPMGRRQRPRMLHSTAPLIRATPNVLTAAGVQRVGRTVGARRGKPELEGGRVVDVKNVVWCTGYHPGFSWIDLPVFDDSGDPRHDRGVVRGEPGLYFVGLHFLYAMSSTMIHGVGRDADYVANVLARRAGSSVRAAGYARASA
jgi:putative flavoprotein involved in K+ transport